MSNQVINLLITKTEFTSDKIIPQNTDDEKVNKAIREAQQLDLRPLLGNACYYDLVRNFQASKVLVTYINLAVATFTVNETVKADNGALGKVLINAGGILTLLFAGSTPWAGAVSITGLLNGATADVSNVDFSDVDKYNKLVEGEEYQDAAGNDIVFSGLRMVIKYFAMARYRSQAQSTMTTHSQVVKTSQYSQPDDRKIIESQVVQDRNGASAYWSEAVDYLNKKASDFPLWKSTCTTTKKTGISISAIGGNSRTSY